jgi:ech hydrogenase subunit A
MELIITLLAVPVITAVLLQVLRGEFFQRGLVLISTIIQLASAIIMIATYYNAPNEFYLIESTRLNLAMIIIEALLCVFLVSVAWRRKNPWVAVLGVLQIAAMFWFELGGSHSSSEMHHHIAIDKLTLLMIGVVALVGGMILIYTQPYMRKYQAKHPDEPDRRPFFNSVMMIFMTAMYGIVLSNDLVWIYFFWELTTICSYLLISYTKSIEAYKNATVALVMNLLGGICFVGAIIYLGLNNHLTELRELLTFKDSAALALPLVLLAIAGMTKSAQLPFSGWLLGAMVAPTPSSALLHSSTMVKAGVYLLIRLSPLLGGTAAGLMVVLIGGLTFVIASFLAIPQSDAKRVLAWSTVANLGLIVACAGIGTYESIWAAMMLILFHAVSKSLLFLSVGSIEQVIGSRDIETMHGLITKLPGLALVLCIGIAGMFLAPFGMLISKWAALKSFIDSGNLVTVLFLVFGSAATLFYWTKWLGKVITIMHRKERLKHPSSLLEWLPLISLSTMAIILCVAFPQVSDHLIIPFLLEHFGQTNLTIISAGNQLIMLLMLVMIAMFPIGLRLAAALDDRITSVYMAGVNLGDNRMYMDSMGQPKRVFLSNWYMQSLFGEKRLLRPALIGTAIFMAGIVLYVVGRLI